MAPSPYGFLHNPSLPSEDDIVAHCLKVGFDARGTTLVDPSTSSIIAWIKYGPNVTIDEARTQDWTAKALRDAHIPNVQAPRVFHAFTADCYGTAIGYIAMEYIDGTDCDVELVAQAVRALIRLEAPTLGHAGGGARSIVHSFFPEWVPNAEYRSDEDFYAHIRNILKFLHIDHVRGDTSTVPLSAHNDKRFLCPSDFNPQTDDGRWLRSGGGAGLPRDVLHAAPVRRRRAEEAAGRVLSGCRTEGLRGLGLAMARFGCSGVAAARCLGGARPVWRETCRTPVGSQ